MHDVAPKYRSAAKELGRMLGERGHTLVWGGSNTGLMKEVADAVQNSSGNIIGITMEQIREKARTNADTMIVAKDLRERQDVMRAHSDAFVLLPGGLGSLDEITEILEFKKHGKHNKPVIILNTGGFYDGLRTQLKRMHKEGFVAQPLESYLHFAETPSKAINILNGQ